MVSKRRGWCQEQRAISSSTVHRHFHSSHIETLKILNLRRSRLHTILIMLSAIGRAAVRRVAAGQQSTNRAYHGIRQFERATLSKGGNDGLAHRSSVLLMYRRSYATTTKAAAKPKSTTAAKAKTTAKPRSKATPAKKPTKATKKPVTKKKVAAKPKKPVKKKLVKKVLTPEKIKSAHIRALKKSVLTPPKLKPAQSWLVYVVQNSNKASGTGGPSLTKTLAASYKNLTPSELEVRLSFRP